MRRTLIEGMDYAVRMICLPGYILGATRMSEDGFYNIYLNDALSPQARDRTLLHELHHICQDDFYNHVSIQYAEGEDVTMLPLPVVATSTARRLTEDEALRLDIFAGCFVADLRPWSLRDTARRQREWKQQAEEYRRMISCPAQSVSI